MGAERWGLSNDQRCRMDGCIGKRIMDWGGRQRDVIGRVRGGWSERCGWDDIEIE